MQQDDKQFRILHIMHFFNTFLYSFQSWRKNRPKNFLSWRFKQIERYMTLNIRFHDSIRERNVLKWKIIHIKKPSQKNNEVRWNLVSVVLHESFVTIHLYEPSMKSVSNRDSNFMNYMILMNLKIHENLNILHIYYTCTCNLGLYF